MHPYLELALREETSVGPSQATVDPSHVLENMTRVIGDFLFAASSLSKLLKIQREIGILAFNGELLMIKGVTVER